MNRRNGTIREFGPGFIGKGPRSRMTIGKDYAECNCEHPECLVCGWVQRQNARKEKWAWLKKVLGR